MIFALFSQPGFDEGGIDPLEPVFQIKPLQSFLGLELIEIVLDDPLTGFAFHVFCGVRHIALSEPVVREQIVQVNTDFAAWMILFKRRASVPLITGE
ncbi:hypothetical protein CKO42_24120 [Lamprobacter modestohalophilus]|uniref:Uncharacterized protein n=1 Tax=Lamprobacter modestohalophilus TaxID=1064514 RepID=A0A9X0WDJ3_9GAMM|nr:hypothetical protein [Lamprobacter modestohalophilus]